MNVKEEAAHKEELRRVKIKLKELISRQLNIREFVPINASEIRNYIYYGFSDKALRPSYWKVLLNYYSPNKFKSEHFYKQARQTYTDIVSSLDKGGKEVAKARKIITTELQRTGFQPTEKVCIERILTVFSVINPAIGYVQGMINLVYVIYHVLSHDEQVEYAKFAEEDTFYMFNNLMSELSSLFINEFDNQKEGIKHRVNEVFDVIRARDNELYEALRKKDLIKTMFPLKWMLLLFSTEYTVEKTAWLWDKVLSDAYRFELLTYCAAAVVILMRTAIIDGTYEECLSVLQKPSIVEPELMFDIADTMRRETRDINEIIRERRQQK